MSKVLSNILKELPDVDKTNYRLQNKALFKKNNKACIIVDDDPTGNQTVYNIPLLTSWDIDVFVSEFQKQTPVFFLLTNSRSLKASETLKIYRKIAKNILKASELTKREFTIISRSDSTLRGHFPLESETLQNNLKLHDAITGFIPVMFEGKRVTVNDTHFIANGDLLTPVNETPFAQDHSFKYSKGNLKEYIQEKSGGSIKASDVFSFSLEDIRNLDVKLLSKSIIETPLNTYCIFNSLNYYDLDKATNALLLAEEAGKKIVYRTSSSFVPSYIGLEPKKLLEANSFLDKKNKNGGLIIVGSYVKKSSEQLKNALALFNNDTVFEVDISKVLSETDSNHIQSLISKIDSNLKLGNDVIIYTSRKLIKGTGTDSNIDIASKVSNALVDLIKGINAKPRYLLAKGGITSHDIVTKGLGMKQSIVLGQILPGIPLWEMGEETKFPKLPYIVFPGNVGDENSLKEIIQKLTNHH